VVFTRPIEDHRVGLASFFEAPGDFVIQLDDPKCAKSVEAELTEIVNARRRWPG
jgi:hypothetical protein